MRRLEASLPGGRRLLALDAAILIWTVAWIAAAIVVAVEVQDLGDLSDTVGTVGSAAEASGAALDVLGDLPVVGDAVGETLAGPAGEIQEAGRSAQESAQSTRRSVDVLSVLLGLAVALIPSTSLLVLYLPARISRVREAQAVEAARREAADDPAFHEFLARRAAQNLSFRRLDRVTAEPWRELAEGRFDRLARAELDDARRREILVEAQTMQYEQGGYIIQYFSNIIDAHTANLGGFVEAKCGFPFGNYWFKNIGFVQDA